MIDIQVIRDLALTASIGVAVLIFTNLILLPILLCYTGVSTTAAERSLRAEAADLAGAARHPLWRFLDLFTQRRWATVALAGGGGAGGGRLRGQPAAEDRRPRPRRARVARRQPLQPRRRLRQRGLRREQRRAGGDGEDPRRRLLGLRHAEQARRAGLAGPPARRRGEHAIAVAAEPARAVRAERGQPEVVCLPAEPGHAQHRHRRRAAARLVQRQLQPADAVRLPAGPQGRHADPRDRHRRGLRRREQHRRRQVPARRRLGRHRGGDQHRRAAMPGARC